MILVFLSVVLNPLIWNMGRVTSAATPDPIAKIDEVQYPSQISLGSYVRITIRVRNSGGEASWQTISVSFPKNPADVTIDSHDLSGADVYRAGFNAGAGYGAYTVNLRYVLAEGNRGPWPGGRTGYLTVRVKPQEPGPFTFYVKSVAARQPDGKVVSWDPRSGTKDQQDEYVQSHFVDVKPPETRAAQIGDLRTDRSTYAQGDKVTVIFPYRNTGSVRIRLRLVVNIVDLNQKAVYDSHVIGEDRDVWVDPGQSGSVNFYWSSGSALAGTHRVTASLRDWNNWGTVYDYRWGDKPGPTFAIERSTASQVRVWFRCKNKATSESASNVAVYVNDEFKGRTDSAGALTIDLLPGTYNTACEGEGYPRQRFTLNVPTQTDIHVVDVSLTGRLTTELVAPYSEHTYQTVEFNFLAKVTFRGKPVSSVSVRFYVDGSSVATASTDASGEARTRVTVSSGTHQWYVVAEKDDWFSATSTTWRFTAAGTETKRPDLVVVGLSWSPDSPRVGEFVAFTYAIKNQGVVGTTSFTTALYVDGQRVDISARLSLGPGEERPGRFTYQWRATAGSHRVAVVVDDLREISESNEDNNSLTRTLEAGKTGSFSPDRKSFLAAASGNRIQCGLFYSNNLGEDVIVMFVISIASSGKVVDNPTVKAYNGRTDTATSMSRSLGPDTYRVSWQAFRASDTSFRNPIAWSTSTEIKTVAIAGRDETGSFVVDHKSFKVTIGLGVTCSLNYVNSLSEDAVILFIFKEANGDLAHVASEKVSKGTKGTARKVVYNYNNFWGRETNLYVSWEAYRYSDTKLESSLDRSTPAEQRILQHVVGIGPIQSSLLYYSARRTDYFLDKEKVVSYRYFVEPKASNLLTINYDDRALELPIPENPVRFIYVFVPATLEVKQLSFEASAGSKVELAKTHSSSYKSYQGIWYEFKVTADTTWIFYWTWNARFMFQISNPAEGVSLVYAFSSSLGDILADQTLDTAVSKIFEILISKITSDPISIFSVEELLQFVAETAIAYAGNNHFVLLDTRRPGLYFQVTVKSKFANHPILGTQEFNDLNILLDKSEISTPITVPLIKGRHSVSVPLSWKTGGEIKWIDLVFHHWEDETGQLIATSASLNFDVSKDKTLFAVYKPVSKVESKAHAVTVVVSDAGTRSRVSQASVYIDEKLAGNTDDQGSLVISEVSKGTHKIKVTKSGYLDEVRIVGVSGSISVTVALKSAQAKSCALTIYVRDMKTKKAVTGAAVYLDGINKGITDSQGRFTIVDVPAGLHTIKASKEGLRDASRSVYVRSSFSVWIYLLG
jgi:hypothetical protein